MWAGARAAAAAAVFLVTAAGAAVAQTTSTSGDRERAGEWSPVVYSWVLRRAGETELDPFGPSGRREVLQLTAPGRTLRGVFQRTRLDRFENGEPSREEGWYEIRGGIILLYHADERGATGRVETGRYLHGRICLQDPEDGGLLSYEYLEPKVEGEDVGPLRSPGAPETGECDATGA